MAIPENKTFSNPSFAICSSHFYFLFFSRDSQEVVIHSDDAFAPVGYLKFKQMHLEDKTSQVR
jgi:hypothetical protein